MDVTMRNMGLASDPGGRLSIPIALLPAELLAKVFVYYTATVTRYPKPQMDESPLDTVFCIMQVCRYWREVALGTPGLWSVFTATQSAAYLDAMLARSKEHPLTVELQLCSDDPDEEACRRVFSHFTRIRHFRLANCPISFMEKFVPQHGPLLQSLILDVDGDYYGEWNDLEGREATIDKFEHCELPALRELSIDSGVYRIQWNSPLLRHSLTHLRLMSCISGHALSFSDVLNALEVMPLLQHLELHRVLPWSFDQYELGNRNVRLSNLRSTHLDDGAAALIGLFEALVFPSSTIIDVLASGSRGLLARWQHLLKAIATKVSERPGTVAVIPFSGALIQCQLYEWDSNEFMKINIHCYRAPCSLRVNKTSALNSSDPFCPFLHKYANSPSSCSDDDGDDARKDFLVRFIDCALDASQFVQVETVVRALPLSELRCLALTGPDSSLSLSHAGRQPTVEIWIEYFQHMASLRELFVQGWGVAMLPEALAILVESPQDDQDTPATKTAHFRTHKLFPRLERLTVLLPHANYMDSEDIFTRFHTTLLARRALGMRLQESISTYTSESDWAEKENVALPDIAGAEYVRYSWFPEGTENTHIPGYTPDESLF